MSELGVPCHSSEQSPWVYDGGKVVLPEQFSHVEPGKVILVFAAANTDSREAVEWMKLQEDAFAETWDNDEDSVYDTL